MDDIKLFQIAVCLVFLLAAAVTDGKIRKIPNWITFPFILCGLLFSGLTDAESLISKAIFLIIVFLFGWTGLIGLGDIKLIMGLGAMWDPIWALLSVALASLSIFVANAVKYPHIVWLQIQDAFRYVTRRKGLPQKTESNSVPFAPYLFTAYVLLQGGVLLWQFYKG